MKRAKRVKRPYLRTRRSSSGCTELANSAGLGRGRASGLTGRAAVEALEARQMLFSLTVTPDLVDPTTGVGTTTAFFGYTIPYIIETEDIDIQPAEVVAEDFNNFVNPIPVNGQPLFSPEQFESGLILEHTIPGVNGARIVRETPMEEGAGRLFLQAQQGQQYSFAFDAGSGIRRAVEFLQLNFTPDGVGFDLNNLRVTMSFNGQAVRTLTGLEIQDAFIGGPAPTTLNGTFNFAPLPGPGGAAELFDEITFETIQGTSNPGVFIDDASFSVPQAAFSDRLDERIFGVQVVLSGPAGASAQFLDLYGREILQTIALGVPQGSEVPIVDRNLDGVPDFNDGIGQIILRNTNFNTAFAMFGGTIMATQMPSADADFVEGGFEFLVIEQFNGLYDEFQQAGFGYDFAVDGEDVDVLGVPPGPGSVIIGSPYVRDQANYLPGGGTPGTSAIVSGGYDLTRSDQGIRVTGGNPIGLINIHGILHGSSVISGSADAIGVGYLVGSITVDGDLGSLIVAGDAGVIQNEESGAMFQQDRILTGAQLVAQRTVGEIAIGGRSGLDVTIVGDINTPGSTPRDPYRYFEKEVIYGLDVMDFEEEDVVRTTYLFGSAGYAADKLAAQDGFAFFRSGPSIAYGLGLFRNDDLLSSEWVGSISAGVQIHGELGAQDPVSSGEDVRDAYSFAVAGAQPILVQISSFDLLQNVRLLDSNGRTVSALDQRAEFTDGFFAFELPDEGVYTLVIQSQGDGQEGGIAPYVVTIGGIAPTTLGSYRVAGANLDNVLSVFAGDIGSVRVATMYSGRGGGLTSTEEVINTSIDNDDDMHRFEGGAFSTSGSLWQILAGGDIEGAFLVSTTFDIGGDLGQLITGVNPVIGVDSTEGDVETLVLNVGGTIGVLDIKGGIGLDQDVENQAPPFALGGLVAVNSGVSGDPGHIGLIRVGATVGGDTFTVTTSENSIIGAFLIEQDSGAVPGQNFTGIYSGNFGAVFTLGAGSDIRFVDINRIDLEAGLDVTVPLVGGAPVTLVDDAGGSVRIEVVGAPAGLTLGDIRVLPVDLSQGVGIGRIDVNLDDGEEGYDLVITSLGAPGSDETISIGRINIVGSGTSSSINIVGDAEVDVYRITEGDGGGGGTGMGLFGISNTTPGGDILAIDISTLTNLTIAQGNLGSTETTGVGPSLAPFIGLITLPPVLIDNDWNGALFRPVTDSNFMAGNAYLDDLGAPFYPFLRGLRTTAGNIQNVIVSGSVGDVIAEGGDIGFVQADSDQMTAFGGFDGIVGVIFAQGDIGQVDVGDGLLQRAENPLSTTGIFAVDDIILITSNKPGAVISSTITAGNIVLNDRPGFGGILLDGVDTIQITGGTIFDAHISATNLDDFWLTPNYAEEVLIAGAIVNIQGVDSDMRRTLVRGDDIRNIDLMGGVCDANQINARGNAIIISADRFLNTTSTGTFREFERNEIVVGGNLDTLRTTTGEGDMSDLRVDVLGQVNDRISARNFVRVDIDVDNSVSLITAGNDIRGSSIIAGEVIDLDVANNFRTSELFVSGPLRSLTADSIIDSAIAVTGPDGEIISIEVRDLLRGSVAASGSIGTIVSTEGDIVARITTTTDRGDVERLEAFRDLDITTDISGTVDQLIAGRNIGNIARKGVILVRGELDEVDVSGGQLYSDLRVGLGITGVVEIGKVSNLPQDNLLGSGSIVSFGRINSIVVDGDFDGSIISHSGGIGSVLIRQGSFLAGNSISAFAGSIDSITINSGHLLGDIHADYRLRLLLLNGDGVFGNIGVSPNLSAGVPSADPTRNQLPPGVTTTTGIDGPRITVGENIGRIILTNGSIYEAFIYAGRSVGIVNVSGDIASDPNTTDRYASVIASGELISMVQVGGSVSNAGIVAGVLEFGDDDRLGGSGVNADTVAVGRIRNVSIVGDATNVTVSSGIVAGEDGIYNSADDLHALGFSLVESVTVGGSVTNTSAFADAGQTFASAGVVLGGRDLPVVGGVLEPVLVSFGPGGAPNYDELGEVITTGQTFNFNFAGGEGTILFNGPGTAIWNSTEGRLILVKSTGQSSLVVTSTNGQLTDFAIQTNNNASLGMLDVQAELFGNSLIVVDGFAPEITIGGLHGNSALMVGNNIRSLTIGVMTGGHIAAKYVENFSVVGDMQGTFELDGSQGIAIGGDFSGAILMHRDLLGDVTVAGAVSRAVFTTGGSAGNFSAHSLSESRISALTGLGDVGITGDVFDSSIMGGVALSRDVLTGGSGFSGATLGAGSVGNVSIGGNFIESDITAGIVRGEDGFFGSSDDSAADGRANVGQVEIGGTASGSNLGSESFRIAATGLVGGVSIGGAPASPTGNFQITNLDTQPLPIQVTDLRVVESSRIYSAQIRFNQDMDSSTLDDALRVSEVRGSSGEVTIRLIGGVDYTVDYDSTTRTAIVTFDTAITRRDLPQVAGVPGPGVYRFELDAAVLRSRVEGAVLDGNGDGFGLEGDNYSQDDIVGDAGDKLTPTQVTVTDPITGDRIVDFYAPINLNVVLDSNQNPDGLADTNTPFTLRGSIGDHPDHSTNLFRFSGDVDVYEITLQAGQILRLGDVQGAANQASVALRITSGGAFESLPGPQTIDFSSTNFFTTTGQNILIEETGTYHLVVSTTENVNAFLDSEEVPNTGPIAGGTGNYSFTIEVFDDGDSGFNAPTNAGDGAAVVNAPPVQTFAGVDGVFGTPDDLSQVIRGQFTFTIDPGEDGSLGTADDIISGDNGRGIVSSRTGGVLTSTVTSAIGAPLSTGVPINVQPDVDVFHLNGRDPIPVGQRIRLTVKLSELGANLGAQVSLPGGGQGTDFSGQVQFGVFETTDSTGIGDGLLVLSPTDFSPIGGEPGVIANDGQTAYGYDENGDFFIEFVNVGSLRSDPNNPAPAALAVYIQGVFNTDYEIEIVQSGIGTFQRQSQNVFIETKGGVIDWLESGGLETELDPFSARVLGFSGRINGMNVDTFITTTLVTNLQELFDRAGLDVTFSTNSSQFEFEDFSTVFLTTTSDPVGFFTDELYGVSEHADVLNADRNDEGAIFIPSMATLGYTPSESDVEDFVESLTGAVARRVGELMGLRLTTSDFGGDIDPQAANSVANIPTGGSVYSFSTFDRALSAQFDFIPDTQFYLGQLNGQSLLDAILAN